MKASSYYRWDWPAAVLLISVVFTAAVRLDTTNWTPDLGYVESLAVLGTLLGLTLGLSQFKRPALGWLVSLYTLVIVPMHLSRIISDEKTTLGQVASLSGRFLASIGLLIKGEAVDDYIFFVILMSVLFWAIGIYAGYRLIRERAIFPVLLPSIVPILVIQYYDGYKPDRIWGLAFYFFLALMLAGRINLLNSHERWVEQHVVAGSDPEFDLSKNIASVAAIIILAAWVIPAPVMVLPMAASVWRNINEPFEGVRKRLDDMLAALNSSRINNTAGELYGDAMSLGRTAGSGEAELFSVHAPQNNLPRLYWRMRVYDSFQNGIWQTTNSKNTPFEPDDGSFVRNDVLPAPVAEFIFTWKTSRSAVLATPSLPVWVSRKGSIQTNLSPGGQTDPLSWNVSQNLQTGDLYQVRALLSSPTQKDLRASGNDYPTWIAERYLQVPKNISGEFTRLAVQVTSGMPTNFDKAEAVTTYLRQNITYNETIPAPPPGIDSLSWFLFGWKSGFCNYYASAEVLLLRSVGIPARMVVGFAQGKSGNYGSYSVRGQDAHAWPEVYFPSIGWVQFEPTVNQTALVRPSGDVAAPSESMNPRTEIADGIRNDSRFDREMDDLEARATRRAANFLGLTRGEWLWVIICSVLVVVAGVFVWRLKRHDFPGNSSYLQRIVHAVKAVYSFYNIKSPSWLDHWIRWGDVSAVERAFHSVNQALTWLGKPQPSYVTPAERALLLTNLLPDASKEIDILNASLEKTLYSPQPANAASAIRAGWMLMFFTVRKILQRWLYGE
jgi:transglutaminase-like putative cysteine protease